MLLFLRQIRRVCLLVVVLCAWTTWGAERAFGQAEVRPFPEVVEVKQANAANHELQVILTYSVSIPVIATRVVTEKGEKVTVNTTEYVQELRARTVLLKAAAGEKMLQTVKGEPLGSKQIEERLKPGAFVLWCKDGKPLDARYVSIVHPDAVILVLSETPTPGILPPSRAPANGQ